MFDTRTHHAMRERWGAKDFHIRIPLLLEQRGFISCRIPALALESDETLERPICLQHPAAALSSQAGRARIGVGTTRERGVSRYNRRNPTSK